ncbi:MAG: hypothetical protein Q4A00_08480, partial [Flavobacteriaceae bacterium]|nr:hypothetical protein [Flavobacteriaceae bacterium]
GDDFGTKTESIIDDLMKDNGYTILDGKYGRNNGFDGFYIKGSIDNPTEIIIVESKQFSYANNRALNLIEHNGLRLNAPNDKTKLPAQMSDKWIEFVAEKLSKNPETSEIGDKLMELLLYNRSKITKYVSAVDKTAGEINFLKLDKYK